MEWRMAEFCWRQRVHRLCWIIDCSLRWSLGWTVGAMLLGPRIGKFIDGKPQAIPGHNMAIATLGALILWIGWYGFNPGSQLAMDQWVPYVAVTTTLAAAGGAIGATVISTLTSGKPDLTMIINGILAGLVSITAGCGNLTFAGAWVAGLIGGIIVVFAVSALDACRHR